VIQDKGGAPWVETEFPHCDQAVLHAPGECEYCDGHPDWQALRGWWGIAFTGHTPEADQMPCPSDFRRGIGNAHRWGGNRPTNVRDIAAELTFASRVLYGEDERV
jgi:hypothetical protein